MDVRIWGARGSYPASGARFSEFGHHTPCVAIAAGDDLLVLDAGSGAAALGEHLSRHPFRRIHLLLSHFHHDHVMGLPFLFYGAGAGTEISVHSALGETVPLARIIRALFSAPYFPGEFASALAGVSFHAHAAGACFDAGPARIDTALLDHPGGSSGYRVTLGGKVLAYASDLAESRTPDPSLIALAKGADLLIHDTMFSAEEAARYPDWGHATAEAAVALARLSGARRLAGFHHGPTQDDARLRVREAACAALLPGAFFAREGQKIAL